MKRNLDACSSIATQKGANNKKMIAFNLLEVHQHSDNIYRMRHKLLQTYAREDNEREESPNVDFELAAQQQNISRHRRFEDDIVATTQGAARDTYVELWAKLPGEVSIPEAMYVKLLKFLRHTMKEASVAPDVVDALLENEDIEDKIASLTQIVPEHSEVICDGTQDIQVFIDVIWEWFDEPIVHSWLEWVCDPDFHDETPLTYTMFYSAIQHLCVTYTDKPLDRDSIIRQILYNLPGDYPVYRHDNTQHSPHPINILKWVRPVRRNSTPSPTHMHLWEADWYRDVVPYTDEQDNVVKTWKANNEKKAPHWHVRIFLKRPLPGVNPWHQRPDPEDPKKQLNRNWFMTKHHSITYTPTTGTGTQP
jgi:hypothetical protein